MLVAEPNRQLHRADARLDLAFTRSLDSLASPSRKLRAVFARQLSLASGGARIAGTAAVAITLLMVPATSAAAASRSAPFTPEQAASSALPGAPIHDRVLPLKPHRRAHSAAAVNGRGQGGWYTVTTNGKSERVKVYVSRSFPTWDPATNRKWAQAFAKMPHGTELSKLTVYLSPFNEISSDYVCGSLADSCYDPNDATVYLSGERPPDGADMTQVAMHEYGHHIANFRSNTPWDSVNWGPKYWASAAGVCSLTRQKLMWPTDAANHYEDHPGEIWAETYRLVASGAESIAANPWEILNPVWNPTSRSDLLNAAAHDVNNPWRGPVTSTRTGRLDAKSASAKVAVRLDLDGQVTAVLKTSGSLKATVSISSASGAQLAAAKPAQAKATICGLSSANIAVTRKSGSGSWTLAITQPGS